MTPLPKKMSYDPSMSAGRPPTKKAPAFGKRLSLMRKERGWTQPELAERLGVTVKAVTYYEREAANPTSRTVERIASVFGMTPLEFMEGGGDPGRPQKKGPPSRLERIFSRVSELPRTKQKLVADMLEGFLEKAG